MIFKILILALILCIFKSLELRNHETNTYGDDRDCRYWRDRSYDDRRHGNRHSENTKGRERGQMMIETSENNCRYQDCLYYSDKDCKYFTRRRERNQCRKCHDLDSKNNGSGSGKEKNDGEKKK